MAMTRSGIITFLLVLATALVLTNIRPFTTIRLPTHDRSIIIVGAGMSGISAAKTLWDAGIRNILILEATSRIGGRISKKIFGGMNTEMGANWIEGVNGKEMNPIWKMAEMLQLRTFLSNYSQLPFHTYLENPEDKKYHPVDSQSVFDESEEVASRGNNYSKSLPPDGRDDISILTFQRLQKQVPATAAEMAVEFYTYDYEFAEPPRDTSLQNTHPLPTFDNFGDDLYFVADQRGYETLVVDLANQILHANDDNASNRSARIKFNKVVNKINYTSRGVTVRTEDGATYHGSYVLVSPSLGVLQSGLIEFKPELSKEKTMAIHKFDMTVYTKIFIKFNHSFWPTGEGTNFFLYANHRRGYYPVWQHFEVEYPGSNILLVTVTDVESKRIEQQPDSDTLEEAMAVLRDMFGPDIPNATDILVPRWWSDRLYKGSFSNWPIGVDRYEFDQIRAPVGRVYFTGEHTSTHYNGYVHGAYLSGIESANTMIECIKKRHCTIDVKPKRPSQISIEK